MRERFYKIVRGIMGNGLYLYFSKIEFVGLENLPKDKAFILAVNHQNAFLDAFIAGCIIPWHFHFLTRSDVFTKRTTYWLKTLKMTPIYRIRDGYDQLGKNVEVFDNCTQLFAEKKAILVFPEGNHGEHHYLRPLTKGTARIALQSQSKLDVDLMIVPCGINYFSARTPRTKVILMYGNPFSVKDYLKEYNKNKQGGLKKLTENLSEEMKKCLIIPEKTDDYEIKVKKVFNPRNEVLSFKKLREFAELDYKEDKTKFVTVPKTTFQKNMIALAGIPNFGPLFLLKKVLENIKDKVFYSSMKYLVMLFAMPIWWLISFLVGWFFFGVAEGFVLIALSIIGLFVRSELKK